ncbi:hypothetical protein V5O48_000346 [Marasmius crinis-equi]|uniref:Myb-like domain-containing protein n=1 Tax=Marasmius crinis-equi TaxID=585013 RepID=A0ABR3G1C9_9AGAR
MTSRVQKGNAIFRPLAKQRSRPTPALSQSNVSTSNESPRPEISLATPPPPSSAPPQLQNAHHQKPPSQSSLQQTQPSIPIPVSTPIGIPLSSPSVAPVQPPTVLPSNSFSIPVPAPSSYIVPPPNSYARPNTIPVPLPTPTAAPPQIQSSVQSQPPSQAPVIHNGIVNGISHPVVPPSRPQPQLQVQPPSQTQPPATNDSNNATLSTDVAASTTVGTAQGEVEATSTADPVNEESGGVRRTKRKRKSANTAVEDDGEGATEEAGGVADAEEDTESSNSKKKARKPATKPAGEKPKRKPRKSTPAETSDSPNAENSGESAAPRKGRRSKSKTQTPPFDASADPGAELDPTQTTMATLCEDTGQGRVSSKAAEILSNHEAWKKDRRERRARMRVIMERKKYGMEEDEEDERGAGKGKEPSTKAGEQEGNEAAVASGSGTVREGGSSSPRASGSPAPGAVEIINNNDGFDYQGLQRSRFNVQVRIGPNGETIIDEESLVVDRVEGDQGEGEYEKVVESDMTKFVNSGTYGKRFRGSRWSKEETELFYDALAQYGENYELISYVLPGRDRKACKNKFKAEDKRDPGRINHCLNNRVPVDMKTLSRMTGKDFSGPTPQIAVPTPPPPPPAPEPSSDQQGNSHTSADRGRKDKPGNNSSTKRSRSRTAAVVEDGVEVLGDVDGYALMDD